MDVKERSPEQVSELAAVAGAAAATMTDGIIARVATIAEQAGSLVDILLAPEVMELLVQMRRSAPTLTKTLQRLDGLEQSGALDTLLDFAEMIQAAKVNVSDGMIARLGNAGRVGLEVMDTLMTSGITDLAPALVQATVEARNEASADKQSVGLFKMLSAFKQPELQYVIKFMLALAKRLPATMQDSTN
ncbi:MAG TPA: DUF1641 domain-containing protein [Symbiobacteriaceae bacterium]|jgi:uncharacterized protein YjgD (DUF1641 family)